MINKKIIVPVDFSENSYLAAQYACNIAINQEYECIHLFHCYNSETSIFDEKINNPEKNNSVMSGDLLMKIWKNSLSNEFPNVKIDTECKIGLISDVLPKIATESNFSLIIMGSNGLKKKDSKVFGSVTSQVARKSSIPVVAVPHDLKNLQIKKAAVLTNFKEQELATLKDFTNLMGDINELDIIHIYPISEELSKVEANLNRWKENLQNLTSNIKVNSILKTLNYADEKLDTVSEVVNKTIEDRKYDIVIVTKSRKSFFEKWFSRSVSKDVILKLETVTFFDNYKNT